MSLGKCESHRAPVVYEHPHALDFEMVQKALDETCVLLDRVPQVTGLAGATEAVEIIKYTHGGSET
jgi:hypothetical protein